MTSTPLLRWPGRTVVVVASGPSLTDEQVALIGPNVMTIAVNSSYTKLAHPDAIYGCDYLWWKHNHMAAKK